MQKLVNKLDGQMMALCTVSLSKAKKSGIVHERNDRWDFVSLMGKLVFELAMAIRVIRYAMRMLNLRSLCVIFTSMH